MLFINFAELNIFRLACIYLATKTQNLHLTMDIFISKIPNTNPELIIQMEVIVLESNDFRPPQFSLVTCVYGFLLDSLPIIEKISEYQDILQTALDRLQVAFMIDEIVLIESPSHVALACVLDSNKAFEA